MVDSEERKARAKRIVAYLKKTYPEPKSELQFDPKYPFQFLAAVIMSAQCTDKAVNRLTATLFRKYKRVKDFAEADPDTFTKEISSIPFYNNKTRAIIGAARMIRDKFGGKVPRDAKDLQALPGVAYKTANVVRSRMRVPGRSRSRAQQGSRSAGSRPQARASCRSLLPILRTSPTTVRTTLRRSTRTSR